MIAAQTVEYRRQRERLWARNLSPERRAARLAKKRARNAVGRIKDPVRFMLAQAKQRAKVQGVPFGLCAFDIEIPVRCPVFGTPLKRGTRRFKDDAPSLDRRDPKKGYVPSNVAVISLRANKIKSDATVEELEQLLAWLKRTGDR